jgi:hypothetical protein
MMATDTLITGAQYVAIRDEVSRVGQTVSTSEADRLMAAGLIDVTWAVSKLNIGPGTLYDPERRPRSRYTAREWNEYNKCAYRNPVCKQYHGPDEPHTAQDGTRFIVVDPAS